MKRFHLLVLAVLTTACTLFCQSNNCSASGLLIADGGLGGKLKIKEQDVRVVINNGIAVTHIDQVFVNTENRIVEALYMFPVPKGASVSNFSMVINGKEMIGEVVEKERARQIYNSYKTTKRDPGLLEQVSYRTFELRVFPIAAGAEQKISLTYYQQLDFDHDQASYVYPLATSIRPDADSRTQGRFSLSLDVKSEIPIIELKSPSHKNEFAVTQFNSNYVQASMEVREGDLSKDVVINFGTERPHTGLDLVTSKQSAEDGYFMLTMTAGKELEKLEVGMDYVFVVDISGSMANDGKLGLSRQAVTSFIAALGDQDRFNVMSFNTKPELQFEQLQPTTEETRQQAGRFLEAQQARGGTVLRPAVQTAYKFKDADRPLNVVILSDGMTEPKEQSELLQLIRQSPAGTRVFCIGIGNDTNRPLLQQLSEGAGGLAAFISHSDDFSMQAQAFQRKLMRPVASQVSIQIEGVGVFDVADEKIPDLYYGSPVRIHGRYRQAGNGTVILKANILGQPFEQSLSFNFPATSSDNPEIERMWAFQRVQALMAKQRASGDNAQAAEIVRLCEQYSIVSEYASFIVLENDAEYKRWSIERRNASRVTRDRAAEEKLRQQLQLMRDESLAQLGPGSPAKLTSTPTNSAPASGGPNNVAQPAPSSAATPATPVTPSQPGDLNFAAPQNGGGSSGGGAIDPVTCMLALAGAGAAWAGRKRKKDQGNSSAKSDI